MLQLQAGDMFLVHGHGLLPEGINNIQAWWSKDGKSSYAHSGVILDNKGTTLECRWYVESNNFHELYKGKDVLVVRYVDLKPEKFQEGYDRIIKHKGEFYPIMRLPLHALHLARHIHWYKVVCSELVAKFAFTIGARDCDQWFGTNVDDLEDEFKHWRVYDVIYEGVV